jgi:hypothetical protein
VWFYCYYLYIEEEVPSLGQRFSETFDLWFFLEEEPGGLEFRSCFCVGGLDVYIYGKPIIRTNSMELLLVFIEGVRERGERSVFCEGS